MRWWCTDEHGYRVSAVSLPKIRRLRTSYATAEPIKSQPTKVKKTFSPSLILSFHFIFIYWKIQKPTSAPLLAKFNAIWTWNISLPQKKYVRGAVDDDWKCFIVIAVGCTTTMYTNAERCATAANWKKTTEEEEEGERERNTKLSTNELMRRVMIKVYGRLWLRLRVCVYVVCSN